MPIPCKEGEYRKKWFELVTRCNAWVLDGLKDIHHWELLNELHRLTPLHHMPYAFVQRVKKLWIERADIPKQDAGQVFDDQLAYWSEVFEANRPVLKGEDDEREAVD